MVNHNIYLIHPDTMQRAKITRKRDPPRDPTIKSIVLKSLSLGSIIKEPFNKKTLHARVTISDGGLAHSTCCGSIRCRRPATSECYCLGCFVQHLPRRKISRKIPIPEAAQHIQSDRVCGCTAFAPEKHGSALKSLMCNREGYDDLL